MNQPYIVLKQTRIRSRYGNMITQLELVGGRDRELYRTYIDPRMRNFANWSHILHHSQHGFVLDKLKVKGPGLVSADSDPIIVWETEDPDQIYTELEQIWQEQDYQKH